MSKRMTDDERIAHAEHLIGELREVTSEAHAAIKDLNRAREDALAAAALVSTAAATAFDTLGAEKVREWLNQYQEDIATATEEATQAVYKRFDDLTALLMGETKQQRRKHGASLPEIALELAAVNDDE